MNSGSAYRKNSNRISNTVLCCFMAAALVMLIAPSISAGEQSRTWVDISKPIKWKSFNTMVYDSSHDVLYSIVTSQTNASEVVREVWRCANPYTSPSWADIGGDLGSQGLVDLTFDSAHNVVYALTSKTGVWRCDNPDTSPWWSRIGGVGPCYWGDLVYDPVHDRLYTAPFQLTSRDRFVQLGIWRCDNPATGPVWSQLSGDPDSDSQVFRYLAYDSVRDILYMSSGDVWRCVNPGHAPSWTQISQQALEGGRLIYDSVHNVLFAQGNMDLYRCISPDSSPRWASTGAYSYGLYHIGDLAYDPVRDVLYGAFWTWNKLYEMAGVWCLSKPGDDNSKEWKFLDIYGASLAVDSAHNVIYVGYDNVSSSSVPLLWRDFSTKVTSKVPIVAERPIYFDYKGWTGGSDAVGATAPDSTFYFAEGTCRPDFDPYITVENPGVKDASVTFAYMKGDGTTASQSMSVPAASRETVHPPDVLGTGDDASHDFSTVVRCTNGQQIVAERPMYFNYKGAWDGGSDAVGATSPLTRWYFAEGTTLPGFDEYVTVLNPGDTAAALVFHYMVEGEGEKDAGGTVAPHSRATFKTADQIGANENASLFLSSDQGVVAERPMYFDYHGVWTGGHDVLGASAPGTDWYFAEGTTRNNAADGSFDEWLCLQNPGGSQIKVNATYELASGQGAPVTKTYIIPARQRLTVSVNNEVGPGKDASVRLTSSDPFIAERPMYFSYHNKWTGGHDVVGATSPSTTYYFAEGTGRPNFEPYFCIQNPNGTPADVTLTYMGSMGWTATQHVTVAPNSRATVNPTDVFGSGQ